VERSVNAVHRPCATLGATRALSIVIQYYPPQLIIEALERLHQQGVEAAIIDTVASKAAVSTNRFPSKPSLPDATR